MLGQIYCLLTCLWTCETEIPLLILLLLLPLLELANNVDATEGDWLGRDRQVTSLVFKLIHLRLSFVTKFSDWKCSISEEGRVSMIPHLKYNKDPFDQRTFSSRQQFINISQNLSPQIKWYQERNDLFIRKQKSCL